MLKIGIIGTGYFGEIHIRVLQKLKNKFKIIGFFDINKEKSKKISKIYNIPFLQLDLLINNSDVINITSSTNSHFKLIKKVLSFKKHVFVEKPMCENLHEIKEIEKVIKQNNTQIQIGFIERFNPAYLSVKQLNIKPKKIKAIRRTTLSNRNKNSCIIKDLMIHDIDIINSFINSSIEKVRIINKRKNYIKCDLFFKNKILVELTSERTNAKSKKVVRKMNIITNDKKEIEIDFMRKKSSINYHNKKKHLISSENNQLEEEMKYLYNCINNGEENLISTNEAKNCSVIMQKIENA
ncbi:MAG: Gfo/Idh/MocA family oxidoreductase [Bacteroidota bacterium]|nr:Gfo/Idh/MocA family oxidoreductase [Bacteroidota bacterium]